MILGHVNAMLGRYGRRIGPDPASLHACTIGGVIANNSGAHALGGERHDKEALRRWFERLGRVLPTLHLTVNNIWVKGWPWHTTVFVQWDGSATLLNGDASYVNRGLHVFTLRWGRVYALEEFQIRRKRPVGFPPKRQQASKKRSPKQL